jgi:tRNA modification GTPase
MYSQQNTICAIATPPGEGAIAIIRISGDKSFDIVKKIFVPSKKNMDITQANTHTLHYGEIKDNGETIDEVVVAIYKSPHSYTGEDAVEIFCHGSTYIQEKIVQLLIDNGATLAQPGEFTMRAFLNHKIDLAQAEAVSDLISSKSKAAASLAIKQLKGDFSKQINQLRQKLIDLLSLIELELDFSEEDVEFADRQELIQLITQIENWSENLIKNFSLGNAIKEGVPVAITGIPNVGKSTLLNLILNENKAIVSEIPGTTRDIVEDIINIEGVRFRIIDTAGIRETSDVVENLGIERSLQAIKNAFLNVIVADPTQNLEENISHIEKVISNSKENSKILVFINKIDISSNDNIKKLEDYLINQSLEYLKISAKDKSFLEKINAAMISVSGVGRFFEEETIAINQRHYQALINIKNSINEVKKGLELSIPADLLTQELKQIMFYLGEISGEVTTDDILGNIFSKFCIGK